MKTSIFILTNLNTAFRTRSNENVKRQESINLTVQQIEYKYLVTDRIQSEFVSGN